MNAEKFNRIVRVLFFSAIIILLITFLFSYNRINKFIVLNNNLVNIYNNLEYLKTLQSSYTELMMFHRNYLLTGEKDFYNDFKSLSDKMLEYISSFDEDSTSEMKVRIDVLVYNKILELGRYVELRNEEGMSLNLIRNIIRTERRAFEEMQSLFKDFEQKEEELKRELTLDSRVTNKFVKSLVFAGYAVSLLFLIISFTLLLIQIKVRMKITDSLKAAKTEVEESCHELKALNNTKDKFVSIMAHDLKSPFNSIIGFSEIISGDYDSLSRDEIIEYSKLINDSSKRVYKLLENLLEWSRVQIGRLKPVYVEFNIKDVIFEVTELSSSSADKKSISIETHIDDFIIFADKNMVHTILRNLISNAIKFTHQNGSIKINSSKEGSEYKIMVKDSGTGMSEETVSKLFSIEKTVSFPGTENETGTGLGLVLCYEFAKLMNGRIEVKSVIDEGSSFELFLPAI